MTAAASQRAAEMRAEFDRIFADESRVETALYCDVVIVEAGAQLCAIRLSELSGIVAGKTIVPVPGASVALRGVAGIRGAILPVYDLAVLIGRPPAASPRWLAVAASASLALSFDRFERQLRIEESCFLASAPQSAHRGGVVRSDAYSGPVLDLGAILKDIDQPSQERPFS
ncbi:hypothetical protein IZ6_29780 [Terrihabitans soli]|uniref:CheW-like domain-containing protein n=1 Tax=Terrihabitans soli TaxID=708113 RepID=A0A6S6QLN0_9HYPH|nr:chemotaxis protein CheW [Terrihabitans soli]BCJ92243.1 hypothetical protein IZ6_29780 [Terrihabitans soli]